MNKPFGWSGVVRLGLVQLALGAMAALTTSTLNRVMVVESGMPAALPAGLVAWHYLVQLTRPRWGHGADGGRRRTPFIIGGMGVLALGALIATDAALMMRAAPLAGLLAGVFGYSLIGAGVGACGTSLLALLAERAEPERKAAAAALAWVMMVVGIVVSAILIAALVRPFTPERLATAASVIAGGAFVLTLLALRGLEPAGTAATIAPASRSSFSGALRETLADPLARRFTVFVFVSMMAYSAQELILEPFAGLVFRLPPAGSAQISAAMHGGALIGMILSGLLGSRIGDRGRAWMRGWIVAGCLGSAAALGVMTLASLAGPPFPLAAAAAGLGLANGVFTVAAVGSMMGLARGARGAEGVRVGVWGAAQATGFAAGGFIGAAGLDVLRRLFGAPAPAFAAVFVFEALMFAAAAVLALRLEAPAERSDAGAPVSLGAAG